MKNIYFLLCIFSCAVTGKIIFEFSRALNTCDDGDLEILKDGTSHVIWSYGDHDPYDNDVKHLTKHDVKGSQQITFGEQNHRGVFMEPNMKTFNLTSPDIVIPCCEDRITTNAGSLYYQMGFDLWREIPEVDENNAVYITRWEPMFDLPNYQYIHHMVLQKCEDLDAEDLDMNNWGESGYGVPPKLAACWYATSPVLTWTLGGSGMTYPPDVGVKVGGPDGLRYAFIEIHYDLPHYVKPEGQPDYQPPQLVQDHTGILFYYTTSPRKFSTVDIIIGINIDPETHIIPAGQKRFTSVAFVDPECVDDIFPDSGEVHIYQAMLHAHDYTVSMSTKQIRDGKELPPVRHDPNYDNYYERYVQVDAIWKPGDIIMTECITDTSMETGAIRGGRPTTSEMCFTEMMVYPAFKEDVSFFRTVDQRNEVPGQFLSLCNNKTIQYPKFIPYEEENKCTAVNHHPIKGDTETGSLEAFDSSKYQQSLSLDPSMLDGRERFKLHYTIDEAERIIHFGVEADTDGWFGLGFSPNGGMKNSDVVIGWVDDDTGKAYLHDMFATTEALPMTDQNQDYFDAKGMQVGVMPFKEISQEAPATQQYDYGKQAQQHDTYGDSYGDQQGVSYPYTNNENPNEQTNGVEQDNIVHMRSQQVVSSTTTQSATKTFFVGAIIGVAVAVLIFAVCARKWKQPRQSNTVQHADEITAMVQN